MTMTGKMGPSGRIANFFINSKLTPLIIIASILLGIAAVIALPREEEPQIIVPMIDIFVQMPGASAKEVEQRVTGPMEKLLWEIPGVEYVYSTSSPGMSIAIVRFYVGQDEEKSIVRLQSKLMANMDRIPPTVSEPLIKPRYIDDVPILSLTFHGEDIDHYTLRRVAAEVEDLIKREPNVSTTKLIGGEQRRLEVNMDPVRMAAYGLDAGHITEMLSSANQETDAGSYPSPDGQILVHTGGFLQTLDDVGAVVVGVYNNRPVYLRDVAAISDGPQEPDQYVFIGSGPAEKGDKIETIKSSQGLSPAVTLTVAKRKGTNAINVAHRVLARIDDAKGTVIPDNIHITVTRNYGETAKEKSDELLFHMFIAIVSVTVLIWFTLGRRESGVIAFAIPVTLSLTLAVFYLYGYTLNRITLFALIFSIGILVDDAIVVVENVVRHFHLENNQGRPKMQIAIEAVDEVGNPTILATLTVIAAILPMAFVGGLMGPYMRPIPIGASAAMVFSLIIAFIVTPWAALRLIRHDEGPAQRTYVGHKEARSTSIYRHVMGSLIHKPFWRWGFLLTVLGLLIVACGFVATGFVKVKMLPFDNKSEFQVIIDMPESSTLEETSAAAMEMGEYLKTVNEVTDFELYIGTSGPFNFNGLVRHYYLRSGSNVADIQVNLADKGDRKDQSHDIAKRVRPTLKKIADRYGARIKVAEVPPGPPVISTLVAEVYGPDYERQREISLTIRDIFEQTPGVVDVDWFMEEDQHRLILEVDSEKAALNGINISQINQALSLNLSGSKAGLLHQPVEREDVPIVLRMPLEARAGIERLKTIKISTPKGELVSLSSLIKVSETDIDRSIYHKNLMPVIYVTGDVAGEKESPVYAILEMSKKIDALNIPEGYRIVQNTARVPESDRRYSMKWDGEWHITYEVFRDLGIAFAVVLVLIFVLVVGWFQSFSTPLVIMVAIPFSLIGILPAHWLMGAFFTATSMIGFIAGAGIVVRNSIILVDFIELRVSQGMPLDQAVIDAGAVRFRPMMLTAAAVIVGASVILFDPIFQGLAISLMAGEIASLLFSRMTVPVLYFLDKRWESRHFESMNHSNDFNPKNILCPVDFSDLSGIALKYAAAGARLYGAKLILLHAGLFELPRYFSKSEKDRLMQEIIKTKEMIQKDLADYLIKTLGKEHENLDVELIAIESDPADAILQTAEKKSIGLIVIGTHGLTGVKRLLLGSVAENVIHNAGVPVFTVRQKEHDFIDVTNPEVSPRIERILCACEIDKDDRATLGHAVSLTERFNARLTVLYSDESQSHEDLSLTRERLCSWISGAVKTRCNMEPVVIRGGAADQIITHAREEKSDLIVIGARHRLFHDAMLLGRTTDMVVRNAPTPVLVIPGSSG